MLKNSQATLPILVAHPDESMCETLSFLLQDEGYSATCALTLEEAISLAQAREFMFILTEIWQWSHHAPLGRTQELRAQAAPTPVGILTSWPISESLAEREGFACVISAPFDVPQLLQHIEAALKATASSTNHQ